MAKSWEEDLWLIISIFNSVLGLHLIFRKLLYFSSVVVPILPIFATVTTDLFYRLLLFSPSYRHKSYFAPLSKRILESACMEIIDVSISETMFCCMEYKSVARFSLLAYGIASLWARCRRPCDIPRTAYGYYKVFWSVGIIVVLLSAWHGNDAYTNHFFVGTLLFSRSSESFIYHLYLEADRHMGNAEYCEWLMRQIGRGAIVRTPMLADLFWTRDLYVPEYRYSV